MPIRPSRRPKIPSQIIAILGAIIAGTLLLAATSTFGDPRLAARAQAGRSARASGDLVRLAWQAMLRSKTTPSPHLGEVLRIGNAGSSSLGDVPHTGALPPAPLESNPTSLFEVLLESAYGAAARGDRAAAISTARDAARLGAEDPRLAECCLALARWWSALEEPHEVAAQRQKIAAIDRPSYLEGTSIELLACLVPPIDRRRAYELLLDDVPDLPPPMDRWTAESGELRFEADAWWSALQKMLTSPAEGLDSSEAFNWDAAFRMQARIDAAGRQWLDGVELPESGLGWQLTPSSQVANSLIAIRRDGSGLTVAALREADLEHALLRATADEVRPPFELRFDPDSGRAQGTDTGPVKAASGEAEVLYGPVRLPQLLRTYSILHQDPEAAARGELTRLALLRGALVVLALAVLGVSLLGARSLGRSRRLAALRSTFVASVSHDLRTPTQAILLMAETLEQGRVGQGSAATRGRYYSRIRREAQRLRRLVEDLLDGARIDRGEGARIQRKDIASASFLEELERAMRESATSVSAKLTIHRGDLPESLSVDPDGVHRAVWNVFENALKYGKSDDGLAQVDVVIEHSGGTLRFTIADQGKGIDPTDYEAVFAPFERLDGRKTRKGVSKDGTDTSSIDSGTGLGLAIVRAIARGHGGDASIEATAIGTQFKLTFPEQDRREDEAA